MAAKQQPQAEQESAEVVPYDPRDEVIPSSITAGLPQFSREQLSRLETFEQAMELAKAQWGDVQDYAGEYGTGFVVVDKSKLIGTPFLILQWQVHDGNYRGGFVAAHVMTQTGDRYIVVDGSTGVYKQLAEVAAGRERNGGVFVAGGLTKSAYPTCKGEIVEGVICGRPRKPSDAECQHCGDTSERRGEGATYYLSETAAV